MKDIKLSYVISTRNKLPYLKLTLKRLIRNIKPDEEIIIADGDSTDGTKEYLSNLLEQGLINIFISEPDKGEAHGYNKCFLLASGELIKVISDDDIFHFPAIEECKQFMLENKNIDVLGTEGGKINPNFKYEISGISYTNNYDKWLKDHYPFSFCGLGLMIRKKSLAITGLFDTAYLRVDAEFSLRISAGKANIAWYTGNTFAHVANQNSNTITQKNRYEEDTKRLNILYFNDKNNYFFRKLYNKLGFKLKRLISPKISRNNIKFSLENVYNKCDSWLDQSTKQGNKPIFKYVK